VLYLLCTGQRPFTGPTELDALRKVQQGEYVPPEQANRKLSPAVAAIVKKAMQVRLSLRYRSAKDMLLAVEEVLRHDFEAAGQSELVQWLAELAKRDGGLPASRRPGLPFEATQVLNVDDIISVEHVPAAASEAPSASAEEPSIATPPPLLAREQHVSPRRRRVLVGMGFALAGVAALALTTRSRRDAPPDGELEKAPAAGPLPPGREPEPSAAAPPEPSAAAPAPPSNAPAIPEVLPTATAKPARATRPKKSRPRKAAVTSPARAKPRSKTRKSG
jgi:hypothetical protein